MAQAYDFPVWGTQGGGLVREVSKNRFVFVEAPEDCPGLKIGDDMPEEWGICPANQATWNQIRQEEEDELDRDLEIYDPAGLS